MTGRRWPFYSEAAVGRVGDLVRAGRSYASAQDERIEFVQERFAEFVRPDAHSLFLGSGTAGLLAGYFGLGLDPGAEVLVPTNTFRATVTPLLLLNLRPVLCDADPVTGNLDLKDAANRVTARTQAIAVTHLWGHPADLVELRAFADRHGLALVEDCSHAHGAAWRGIPVGSVGDVAVFSLGTKKMVSGGAAGILLAKDRQVFERATLLGHPKPVAAAIVRSEELSAHVAVGFGANLRGTPLAAELVLDHLERLPDTVRIKNENTELLLAALGEHLPGLAAPSRAPEFDHGAWYAIRARWTDPALPTAAVLAALQAEGVPVERQGTPLHRHALLGDPKVLSPVHAHAVPTTARSDFPVAEQIYADTIGWDTRELYEPAADIVARWSAAFARVAANLQQLASEPTPTYRTNRR
jgi:dTDP-4-amino-4,6-dideoxygalactose transaminase